MAEGDVLQEIGGYGTFTAPSRDFYAQDDDPGAVGAGSVWFRPVDFTWWMRNAGNTVWDAVFQVFLLPPPDESPTLQLIAEADGVGNADAFLTSRTQGDGNANSGVMAEAPGTGNAYATLGASNSGFSASFLARADATGVYLGLTSDAADRDLRGGSADPSAGAGVVGNIGSEYHRNNGGVGELWYKTGAADTAWTKLTP